MINLADLLREQARLSEAPEALWPMPAASQTCRGEWKTDVLVETAEVDRDLRLWDESISLWNEAEQLAHDHDSSKFDAIIAGGHGRGPGSTAGKSCPSGQLLPEGPFS